MASPLKVVVILTAMDDASMAVAQADSQSQLRRVCARMHCKLTKRLRFRLPAKWWKDFAPMLTKVLGDAPRSNIDRDIGDSDTAMIKDILLNLTAMNMFVNDGMRWSCDPLFF